MQTSAKFPQLSSAVCHITTDVITPVEDILVWKVLCALFWNLPCLPFLSLWSANFRTKQAQNLWPNKHLDHCKIVAGVARRLREFVNSSEWRCSCPTFLWKKPTSCLTRNFRVSLNRMPDRNAAAAGKGREGLWCNCLPQRSRTNKDGNSSFQLPEQKEAGSETSKLSRWLWYRSVPRAAVPKTQNRKKEQVSEFIAMFWLRCAGALSAWHSKRSKSMTILSFNFSKNFFREVTLAHVLD